MHLVFLFSTSTAKCFARCDVFCGWLCAVLYTALCSTCWDKRFTTSMCSPGVNKRRRKTFGDQTRSHPWDCGGGGYPRPVPALCRLPPCAPLSGAVLPQIFLWEQNLEQFHVDLFRCRCYLASLQGGESPNPKRLLAVASRPTKLAMGRLGVFSVSSFHALVRAGPPGALVVLTHTH